jgi:hypothetical protein
VDPAPVISIPKLPAGDASQACACAVTSTRTKVFATLAFAVVKTEPTVGEVDAVTVFSPQELVTGAKFSVPPAATLFANTQR